MAGAALPVPQVAAISQAGRRLRGALTLDKPGAIAAFLRDPANFPLFAKPAAGKYGLNVISADAYDPASDELVLFGGARRPVPTTAQTVAEGAGYVIQPRLRPVPEIEANFGPRLWSLRLLVFIRPNGPHIHRAVAKIATGDNAADNYWRPGNMLGAIDLSSGRIVGVVRGTGAEMTRDEPHPDTGLPVIGFGLPHWTTLCGLAREAATVFPGIRTQSWDIAVTDQGPVLLEVNFGGDLNLAQLAEGKGVLDDDYRAHLRQCGFRHDGSRHPRLPRAYASRVELVPDEPRGGASSTTRPGRYGLAEGYWKPLFPLRGGIQARSAAGGRAVVSGGSNE